MADGATDGSGREDGRFARLAEAVKRLDGRPQLVKAAQALRHRLPGDREYGDPLSVAGSEPPHILGQRLAAITEDRPSALREVGLGALQVWQSVAESQGRGRGTRDMAILFTDLVDFSTWALEAGDDKAVRLLRDVGRASEPAITSRGGRIVKRLGDGLMAVFDEPAEAVEAALEACRCVRDVQADGYRPELRSGIHYGRPRKLGGDYLGVDVNVAARVASAAGPEEVLVSEAVRERLGDADLNLRRRWRFKAKGAPSDLKVFAIQVES